MHTSTSSINLFTTDLGTAETRPLDELDYVPLVANEAFPSINPATIASEAFEAPLPVQHDETPAGDTVPCQDTSMSSMVPMQLN